MMTAVMCVCVCVLFSLRCKAACDVFTLKSSHVTAAAPVYISYAVSVILPVWVWSALMPNFKS